MFHSSRIPVLLVSVLIAGDFSMSAFAGNNQTPGLDKREANQAQRIEKGVKSGRLTAREAGQLQAMESKLAADEAAAKADGKVTKQERKALREEANADSKAIHALKHNAEKASVKKEGKKKTK